MFWRRGNKFDLSPPSKHASFDALYVQYIYAYQTCTENIHCDCIGALYLKCFWYTNSIRTVDCDYIFVKYKFLQLFFIASKLKHCNKQWLSCFFGCRKDLIGNCIMILESYNWLKSTTKSNSVVIKYGTDTFKM